MRGTAANLVVSDVRIGPGTVVAHYGFDPELVAAYNDYYVGVDPVNQAAHGLSTAGVVCSNHLMPDSRWEATELYSDMCRPFDVFYLLGGALEMTPERHVGVGILRPRSAGSFESDDLERYGLLAPHLTRAAAVQTELAQSRALVSGLAATLDGITVAAMLLDRDRRVVFCNRAAEDLLAAEGGLAVVDGRLTAESSSAATAIRRAFQQTVALDADIAVGCSPPIIVSRREGRRPLSVVVSPVPREGFDADPGGVAALALVFDPDRRPQSGAQLLRALYGLTPAEARCVSHLVAGRSLAEIGELLEVSQTTLKSHLRAAFDKTGTRRQAELVAVLLRGPLGALAGGNGKPPG